MGAVVAEDVVEDDDGDVVLDDVVGVAGVVDGDDACAFFVAGLCLCYQSCSKPLKNCLQKQT